MESSSDMVSPWSTFDKRDFVDFLQGGHALAGFGQRGIAQEGHTLFARGAANFRGGPLFENHFANALREGQQLMNRSAAAESRAAALEASGAFVKGDAPPLLQAESALG